MDQCSRNKFDRQICNLEASNKNLAVALLVGLAFSGCSGDLANDASNEIAKSNTTKLQSTVIDKNVPDVFSFAQPRTLSNISNSSNSNSNSNSNLDMLPQPIDDAPVTNWKTETTPLVKSTIHENDAPTNKNYISFSQTKYQLAGDPKDAKDETQKITWTGKRPPAKQSYQFMAQLFVNGKSTCGGALIEHEWILTSALCVDNLYSTEIKVSLGNFSNGYHYNVVKIERYRPALNGKRLLEVIDNTYYKDKQINFDKPWNDDGSPQNEDNLALLKINRDNRKSNPHTIHNAIDIALRNNFTSATFLGFGLADNLGSDRKFDVQGTGKGESPPDIFFEWKPRRDTTQNLTEIDDYTLQSPMEFSSFCRKHITSKFNELCVTLGDGDNPHPITAADLGGPLILKGELGTWELIGLASYIKIFNYKCEPKIAVVDFDIPPNIIRYEWAPDHIANCTTKRYGVYNRLASFHRYREWINRVIGSPCHECVLRSKAIHPNVPSAFITSEQSYLNGDEIAAYIEIHKNIDGASNANPRLQIILEKYHSHLTSADKWRPVVYSNVIGLESNSKLKKITGSGSGGRYRWRVKAMPNAGNLPVAFTIYTT